MLHWHGLKRSHERERRENVESYNSERQTENKSENALKEYIKSGRSWKIWSTMEVQQTDTVILGRAVENTGAMKKRMVDREEKDISKDIKK